MQLTGFDAELARRAEIFGDKWMNLYKYSHDDGIGHVIRATAIGGHNVKRFNVQGPIVHPLDVRPDSIIDQKKPILLHKKYFKFNESTSSDPPVDSHESAVIEKYVTIFDQSDEQNEIDSDSNPLPTVEVATNEKSKPQNGETQQKTQSKNGKKKKGRTKYRPLTFDEATTTEAADARRNVLAAPPGVKALKSPFTHPRSMDLTKNGNYSLQFRL